MARRVGYSLRPLKSGRWQLLVRAADGAQVASGSLDLGAEVELTHLRTEVTGSGGIDLTGDAEPVTAVTGDGIGRMDLNEEIFQRLMDDPDFAAIVRNHYRRRVYERLRAEG